MADLKADHPEVSIVSVWWAGEALFRATARSLLRQSFRDWEWLIVTTPGDAGACSAILGHIRDGNARIQTLEGPAGSGADERWLAGFQAAGGSCVVPLPLGEFLEPTALEKWFWCLKAFPDFALVGGGSVEPAESSGQTAPGSRGNLVFELGELPANAFMIRRSVLKALRCKDPMGEDAAVRFVVTRPGSLPRGVIIPELLSRSCRGRLVDEADDAGGMKDRRGLARRASQGASGPGLLMVVPWLTLGGADKFNLDLVGQLAGRGWKVTVATTLTGEHPWMTEFLKITPDVFALDHFLSIADYPSFLLHLIASRKPAFVMISNSELGYRLLPYLRSRFPEVVFVDYCHSEDPSSPDGGYPGLSVKFADHLDLTIVASDHLREWMTRRGAVRERIEVCHVNVDVGGETIDKPHRRAVRSTFGIPETTPLILYVGRLCHFKQPRVFAKVAKELHSRGHRFAAMVIGDGEDRIWLEGYLKDNRLDGSVKLVGALPPQRVREIMATGDIFFLPSAWEGIALTIYEAMAAGLPVVAADVGGQRELVTPDCGMLIARGSEEEEVERYVQALAHLLNDPALRREMGRRGWERVRESFDLDGMGRRMIHLLDKARSLHQRAPHAVPGRGTLQEVAPGAFEYIRLYHRFERLWFERNEGLGGSTGGRLYSPFKKLVEPLYRFALARGWRWLVPLKDILKQRLRVQ